MPSACLDPSLPQRFSLSHPPCPVYLLIIVFKHAQCVPRSVLASHRPSRPSRPQRFSSSHAPPPPPMPRLSHNKGNKGYLSMPTACLDPSLPPLPLPPFPPPAVQFISCSSLPPCPVYLIKIVLKHAQCVSRSVPVPIPAPRLSSALPVPSNSVHLFSPPPPEM